ncbi:phage tail protein [Enterococcus casseliflavus]|uniref:phage tail spike protein n=1 Tax=Enterococcus casseliflavus TaxID=37734 RepID=UPI002DB5CCF3|nr:phage tail spike protein [Enterococcus casseliflavus]MEB6213505.1 phage tail protein [Enterococcus casseliflavus]
MNFYIQDKLENQVAILSSDEVGEHTPINQAILEEKVASYEELSISVRADFEDSKYLENGNIIIFKDLKGWREHFIIDVEDIDSEATVSRTATTELSSSELIDEIIEINYQGISSSPENVLHSLLVGTRWSVGMVDESIYNKPFKTNTENMNVLEAIYELADEYSCEPHFSYEVSNGKISARKVNLYKEFGQDSGKRFEADKDITEIKRISNTENIKTAIIPYGADKTERDAEADEDTIIKGITIEGVEWSVENGDPVDKPLGQKWLGDPRALETWGRVNIDGSKRHRKISMQIDVDTPEQLISMAWVQLNRYVTPSVTYETKAFDLYALTQDEDYLHEAVSLGDKVVVIDKYFSSPITVKTRVVEAKRDLLDPLNNDYTFGVSQPTISTKDSQDAVKDIQNEIGVIKEVLAGTQLNADGKTTTFRGSDTPVGASKGDIWFRPHPTVTGERQMLVFNGTTWDLEIDTSIASIVSAELLEVKKDTASAIKKSDKAVEDAELAIGKAEELEGAITSKVDSEDYSSKMSQIDSAIQAKVSSEDYEAKMTLVDRNINLRVEKDDIIHQINVSDEEILIQGDKIIISGETTVDGTFKVTDEMIALGVSADKIVGGTINGKTVNIIDLNADNITGGNLNIQDIKLMNGDTPVLSVNQSGEVELNIAHLQINADSNIATKDDLEVESPSATITVDEATYPLYTNKAQDNGAVQPIIYGNTVRDNENLLSVPTEIVSSYYPEQDSEVDINDSNNVKVLAKKWADEYLEYLLHNTTDEEPLAINSLGLVGASYITDNPLWSYTPPTTSTSEAQILVIRGLLKNYTATSEQKWLDLAQKLTDALLQYYYPTPNVPTEPQSHWVPHWLVNVTAPFTSREYFTNGEADFVNGVATVNYNKVFRIYSVRATDATLEYEWSPDSPVVGTSYEIENTTVEYGQSQATITLKDKTFNGTALVVYSSETGQVINVGDKCEAFPVWRPLEEGEIACAVDALPWALDVFDLWYQITGEEKWLTAVESTKLAILEVSEVSNTKYYIKAGANGEEVLKNGITNFSLRNPKETYTNQDGLILIDYKDSTGNDEGSFGTWVGDKLPLNDQSWIELRAGSNRQEKVSVTIDEESEYSPDRRWKSDFYLNGTGVADTRTVVLKNTDFYKDGGVFWGEQYGREANGGVIASGNSSVTSKTTILDINDKLVKVTELDFVKGDEGGWLGWAQYMLSIWGVSLPFSMKYRTNSDIDFRVNDASGTPWNYRLPKTGNKFETIYLTEALLTNGQGNFAEGDYQSIVLEAVSEVSKIEIEYIGNLETYDKDYYSTVNFSYSKQEALQVGIEYIKPAPSRNPLPYSPYILPFDMHYINYELSNLRGAIYSGYQAPWIFQEAIYTDMEYSLTTNLQFLADAQQAYENLTDYHGFFAPIFWWDYENDSSGREPNTFGMEGNWGEVWGGFQYRTISDVARVFERDPDNARAFNIFVNFIKGVDEYWGDTYTGFPTKFVANQAPHNDQTDSHMVTNFMRSLLYGMKSSRLTDSDKTLIAELFKKCMNYLNHYRIPVRDFDSSLEGTWSPDLQNQTWFQYWGGDILDTLGMVQFQDFSPIKDFIDPIYDLDIKDLEYDKVVNKTYKTKLLNIEPLKKVQESRDKLFLDPEDSLWKIERKVGVLNWDSNTILQKKTVGSKTLVYTPTNDKKLGSYISDKYNYVDKNGVLYDTQDSIEFVGVLIENENELKLPITFMYELANTTFEVLDSENQRKMNNIISFKGHNYVYTINLEDSKENKITPLISGTFKSATWNTKKKLEEQYATKEELSTKADANALSGQIGELAKDVSDYISSSATKDEVGEIYNSLQEYYVLLNENHLDAQKALEDIHNLVTERIPLIENNLGDFTEKWNFIDTYMVAGEEGFFIGDKVNNTGIRISDDRIDFIGGDLEEPIAYITNQVMKINRAIFVESITVGGHKIETLPSGITIFNWVGSMNG